MFVMFTATNLAGLSSSQLCPSSVNTRSCPAFRVFNSKESALTVVLRIYSGSHKAVDHVRVDWTALKFFKKAFSKFLFYNY